MFSYLNDLKGSVTMTLADIKELLDKNGIAYEQVEYENEKEYWLHVLLFPCLKYAKECKVIALVIPCANKNKNIEIQFDLTEVEYTFIDLFFGSFSYEMFDVPEEMLKEDLTDRINEIIRNQVTCITKYNLKRKQLLFDGIIDKNDTNDICFGAKAYARIIKKIDKKKNLIQRILKTQIQYEIYDYETYRCIIK